MAEKETFLKESEESERNFRNKCIINICELFGKLHIYLMEISFTNLLCFLGVWTNGRHGTIDRKKTRGKEGKWEGEIVERRQDFEKNK